MMQTGSNGSGGSGGSGNRGRGRGRGRGGAGNNTLRNRNRPPPFPVGGAGGGGQLVPVPVPAPAPAPAPLVVNPQIAEINTAIKRWETEIFLPGVVRHNHAGAVKMSFDFDPTSAVAREAIPRADAEIQEIVRMFHESLRAFTYPQLVHILSQETIYTELESRYPGIINIVKRELYLKLSSGLVRTSIDATGRRGSVTCSSELSRILFVGSQGSVHWGGWADINIVSLLSTIKYFNFLGLTQHLQCKRVTSQAEFDSAETLEFKGPENIYLTGVITSNKGKNSGHSFAYVRGYSDSESKQNWYNADDVHGVLIPRMPSVPPSWTTPNMFSPIETHPTTAMILVRMPSTRRIIEHEGAKLTANVQSNVLTTGQQKEPERLEAFRKFVLELASYPFIGHPLFAQGGSGTCGADALSSVLAFSDGLMYVTHSLYINHIQAIINSFPLLGFSNRSQVIECCYRIASALFRLKQRVPAPSETHAVMDGYIRGTHAAGAGGNVLPAAAPAGLAVQNITHYVKQNILQQNAAGVSLSHRLWIMQPLPPLESTIQGISLEYQARTLKYYALVFIRLHFLKLEAGTPGTLQQRQQKVRELNIRVNAKGPHPPPNAGGANGRLGGGAGSAGSGP